jgi:hypothetical protein
MNRCTRALASLAIALMAAVLSIAPALAQDATPVAEEEPAAAVAEELRPWVVSDPFTPAPDECTVDAVDLDSLAGTLATPIPVVAADVTSAGINAMDVTGLADHPFLGLHQCWQPSSGGRADDAVRSFGVLRDRSLPHR